MAHEFIKIRRVEKTQVKNKNKIVHHCKIDNKKANVLEFFQENQRESIQKCCLESKEVRQENELEIEECLKQNVKKSIQVYDLEEGRATIEEYVDHDSTIFEECNKNKNETLTQERAKEYQREMVQGYDLEQERKMIKDYIENDVTSSYNDSAAGLRLLAEPDQIYWPNLSMKKIHTEKSTDSLKALIHLCPYCNVMFETEHILKSHSCFKPSSFKSTVRNESIAEPTKSNVAEGVITVIDELTITCDDTNKLFKKQLRTKRNVYKTPKKQEANSVRSRNDKGPHICHICNKSLSRRSSLLIHMRRHTGEMPYECDYCERKFVVQYDLDRHMGQHVPKKKYSFHCAKCRKPFVSKSGLLQHYDQYHEGKNYYSCDICGQYFKTKTTLIKHKVEHEAITEMTDPSKYVKVVLLY